MSKLIKCDLCEYRNKDKRMTPCAVCSSNKQHISHFKPDPMVEVLRNALDIKEEQILKLITDEEEEDA